MQNEINQKILGQRIQKARKSADMSQEKLAEILGLSVPHLSKIENGHKGISLETAVIIAHTFDLSLDGMVRESMSDFMKTFAAEVNCIAEDCTEKELLKLLKLLQVCKEVIKE